MGELAGALASLSGSLLEVYVFGVDRSVWTQALEVLVRHAASIELVVNDGQVDVAHFEQVTFDPGATRMMRALIEGAEWTSTLFREDQVDLQLDPDDFLEGDALSMLLEILHEIAEATGRTALLMPETAHPEDQRPLAVARPSVRRKLSEPAEQVPKEKHERFDAAP